MSNTKYNVFISYRREGGDTLATLLYTRLKEDGYAPFLDVETLRSGKFNEQLYDKIAECEDFLCVLPPAGLDRCQNADDWVRLEIARAIELKKNIVPVLMRGFAFPGDLPPDISELALYNGISASMDYFDAMYNRLKSMLVSKPTGGRSFAVHSPQQGRFFDLLEKVYGAMTAFRSAFLSGDQAKVNAAVASIQQVMQEVYDYYERNQFVGTECTKAAQRIVSEFNRFVGDYGKFASFPPALRLSPAAQQYAQMAEKTFNELLSFVIKTLSAQREEDKRQ